MQRILSYSIYAVAGLMGLAAFLYPFFLPELAQVSEQSGVRGTEAPILTTVLLLLCLVVLLIEVQGQAVSAKMVAALGVLVAITAVLRFPWKSLSLAPPDFRPFFAPIILTGYVFGAQVWLFDGHNDHFSFITDYGRHWPLAALPNVRGWLGRANGGLAAPSCPSALATCLASGSGVSSGAFCMAPLSIFIFGPL